LLSCVACTADTAAILRPGDLDQLLRGALAAADVKVVADQQQERDAARKLTRASDRVAVAEGCPLFDELKPPTLPAGSGGVSGLVSRANDDTDFFDAGCQDFLDENP